MARSPSSAIFAKNARELFRFSNCLFFSLRSIKASGWCNWQLNIPIDLGVKIRKRQANGQYLKASLELVVAIIKLLIK